MGYDVFKICVDKYRYFLEFWFLFIFDSRVLASGVGLGFLFGVISGEFFGGWGRSFVVVVVCYSEFVGKVVILVFVVGKVLVLILWLF